MRDAWAQELPDLDTEGMAILGRMRRITLASRPRIEAVFEARGLDAGEFDVLATLRRAGGAGCLRPTELYQALMISSGGLTARLTKLEREGLVTRKPSEQDARSLLVQLTAKGKRLVEQAIREDMAVERDIIAALAPADRKALASLLAKLAAAIEAREA
jgi:DNA-binding MarR family transcriptional regulator